MRMYRIHIILFLLVLALRSVGQTAFECRSQIWMLDDETDRIINLEVNTSNNALLLNPFLELDFPLDAIAFRSTDNLLYALSSADRTLYRIDATGSIETVTTLDLPAGVLYDAFGFTADGGRLVILGHVNESLESINVYNFGLWDTPTVVPGTSGLHITDLSVNPLDGLFYGINLRDGRLVSFDVDNFRFLGLTVPLEDDVYQLAYSDAFGVVNAFGSAQFGVASGLWRINTTALTNFEVTTGPESYMKDVAACPFGVGLHCSVNPLFSFPCNEVTYTYTLSNSSGRIIEDCFLESHLPTGFVYDDLSSTNIEGDIDFSDDRFVISNLTLPRGQRELSFTVELDGSLTAGNHAGYYEVSGLPSDLGSQMRSDNPNTARFDDTNLDIRVLDSDEIFKDFFFCLNVDAVLDGSLYGTEFEWSDGSVTPTITVSETGTYFLEARTGCQLVTVEYEVTIASCPYTIDLIHTIEPDTVFPCSYTEYYFTVDNDTGTPLTDIDLLDTLPQGLTFVELLKNPFSGTLENDLPSSEIQMTGMEIPIGLDTVIFKVQVGDVNPGIYLDQAVIQNFPDNLGSFRLSDDPETNEEDASDLIVQGTESDTNYVEVILCAGEEVVLEGSVFGTDFLWFSGSTESEETVSQIGLYELRIFSGCEVSFVFFEVMPGADIRIEGDDSYEVFLGDSIMLQPQVYNEDDSLLISWTDPRDTTLSCHDCLQPYSSSYWDVAYLLKVSNAYCADSTIVSVEVDNARRIYMPNVISDKILGQETFYLSTPDVARVHSFSIYDRYGNLVQESREENLSDNVFRPSSIRGLSSGVYLWKMEATFLDEIKEVFAGTFVIVD